MEGLNNNPEIVQTLKKMFSSVDIDMIASVWEQTGNNLNMTIDFLKTMASQNQPLSKPVSNKPLLIKDHLKRTLFKKEPQPAQPALADEFGGLGDLAGVDINDPNMQFVLQLQKEEIEKEKKRKQQEEEDAKLALTLEKQPSNVQAPQSGQKEAVMDKPFTLNLPIKRNNLFEPQNSAEVLQKPPQAQKGILINKFQEDLAYEKPPLFPVNKLAGHRKQMSVGNNFMVHEPLSANHAAEKQKEKPDFSGLFGEDIDNVPKKAGPIKKVLSNTLVYGNEEAEEGQGEQDLGVFDIFQQGMNFNEDKFVLLEHQQAPGSDFQKEVESKRQRKKKAAPQKKEQELYHNSFNIVDEERRPEELRPHLFENVKRPGTAAAAQKKNPWEVRGIAKEKAQSWLDNQAKNQEKINARNVAKPEKQFNMWEWDMWGNLDEDLKKKKGDFRDPWEEGPRGKPEKEEDEVCVVCMNARRTAIFAPCAHKSCCISCANQIITVKKTCPLCWTALEGVIECRSGNN